MAGNSKGIGDMIDDLLGGDMSEDDIREENISGQKGGQSNRSSDDGRGWHGDSSGHSQAAKQRSSSRSTTNRSSGSKGGSASRSTNRGHNLTQADRSKGGRVSASRQDMRDLGRRGGKA